MDQDFECERRKQRRYDQIGANNPRCPDCAETDWRCFLATTMPRCANCAIKARPDPNNSEAKRRRLKKLGTTNPHCAMCGEGDWRCFEEHHVGRRKHDSMTILLCANDHLKVSNDQKDHPSSREDADLLLVQISNFLRGLADMLRLVAQRLIEFADALLERAQPGPVTGTKVSAS
jgi:hypothetical protein